MATTGVTTYPGHGLALHTWASLANGDTGQLCSIPRWTDKTVTITGTFGAAGSVTIEGSNDATNWVPVHDPQGNNITKTTADVETILENPLYLRARVTAGDGTTNLTVIILGVQVHG